MSGSYTPHELKELFRIQKKHSENGGRFYWEAAAEEWSKAVGRAAEFPHRSKRDKRRRYIDNLKNRWNYYKQKMKNGRVYLGERELDLSEYVTPRSSRSPSYSPPAFTTTPPYDRMTPPFDPQIMHNIPPPLLATVPEVKLEPQTLPNIDVMLKAVSDNIKMIASVKHLAERNAQDIVRLERQTKYKGFGPVGGGGIPYYPLNIGLNFGGEEAELEEAQDWAMSLHPSRPSGGCVRSLSTASAEEHIAESSPEGSTIPSCLEALTMSRRTTDEKIAICDGETSIVSDNSVPGNARANEAGVLSTTVSTGLTVSTSAGYSETTQESVDIEDSGNAEALLNKGTRVLVYSHSSKSWLPGSVHKLVSGGYVLKYKKGERSTKLQVKLSSRYTRWRVAGDPESPPSRTLDKHNPPSPSRTEHPNRGLVVRVLVTEHGPYKGLQGKIQKSNEDGSYMILVKHNGVEETVRLTEQGIQLLSAYGPSRSGPNLKLPRLGSEEFSMLPALPTRTNPVGERVVTRLRVRSLDSALTYCRDGYRQLCIDAVAGQEHRQSCGHRINFHQNCLKAWGETCREAGISEACDSCHIPLLKNTPIYSFDSLQRLIGHESSGIVNVRPDCLEEEAGLLLWLQQQMSHFVAMIRDFLAEPNVKTIKSIMKNHRKQSDLPKDMEPLNEHLVTPLCHAPKGRRSDLRGLLCC